MHNKVQFSLVIFGIVLGNLIPIYGVLNWGWNVQLLLKIYWIENLIVGLFNIQLILGSNGDPQKRNGVAKFFALHYGGFWICHGLLLFLLVLPIFNAYAPVSEYVPIGPIQVGIALAALGILMGQTVSYLAAKNLVPISERPGPVAQAFMPYGRVFILHFILIIGGFYFVFFTSAHAYVIIFAGLKILFEILTEIGVFYMAKFRQNMG